ncbi:ULK/ULK protein kinase [Coniosporium apollinis CBS 100218]|uniref:non-specific serine/threonine protein kinase n=1 Tax=Coniosporium apollinis (strain CBS 100218) TaxID=1168221 RepID=R7YY75_CONA1|nr:ULK/ULK protein kinase [Coniosporium apollinis CBS 100218]EON66739.1 ULK/ULK protein kinase [Coniosporium apollinis CBS 100218]
MATPSGTPRRSTRTPAQAEPEPVTMIGPFQKLESIGKGSFAMVYRGVHVKQKSLVAIKSVQLYKLNSKLKDNLLSEIKILRSLQHPHIVAMIDCKESSAHMHIVTEFCELGDLSAFIKKRSSLTEHPATADMIQKYPNPAYGGLNEVVVRHFLKQIASALEFLRAKNCMHRDIKPQNLLINPSPQYYAKYKPEPMPLAVTANSLVPATGIPSLPMLKVADFGFARFLPQTSLAETLCGSPLYMAPEILRYEKYDAKADLWSVGTVLHEMMTAKPPFRAGNHVELLRKIEKQDDDIRFPRELAISTGMKHIIRSLLKKAPIERISFESFFDHQVIKEEIPGLVGEDLPSKPESQVSALIQDIPSRTASAPESSRQVSQQQEPIQYPSSPRPKPFLSATPPSRPTSRPTATGSPSTPPRAVTGVHRHSNAPQPSNEPQQAPPRERRPPLMSHATAPARQIALQERVPVAAAVAMERRHSRNSPSPSSSMLKEHFERERNPRGVEDRALREAREKAANDIAFERDYVLVEKRTVEVNALADELAASPQLHRGFSERPSSPHRGAMVRRATTQGAPASAPGTQGTPSRAIHMAAGRQRPEGVHQANSYERRYGPNPGSATSVISKALNMANFRLFGGIGISPPFGKGPSPPQGYGAFPTYPTAQSDRLLLGTSAKPANPRDEDAKVLMVVEELAHRSNVVYGFAEVKFKQLLPAGPLDDHGIGGAEKQPDEADAPEEEELTTDAIVTISEEALVLYVKALGILSRSIDLVASWWNRSNRGGIVGDNASPTSHSPNTTAAATTSRMNHVLQWARARFNECFEKSEFAGRKLMDAQKQLPLDHPGHPNNHPSASGSATSSIGTSAENIILTTGITAEKLMYDRALEMSRAAAVNELVGEDLAGCEINYCTAIHMLEAILDGEYDIASGRSKKDSKTEAGAISGLENGDRVTVQKLVESMKARLKALRKKIEMQKAAKRASLSGTASSGQTLQGKGSPSPTPLAANTPPR